MAEAKKTVGVLFGGRSAEHEVSLLSAKNVVDAIDRDRYDVVLIGIDKSGKWLLPDQSSFLLSADDPRHVRLNSPERRHVALVPRSEGQLTDLDSNTSGGPVDVAFPVLHGPFGEDGTVQGLLKLADLPFVGAGVLGSAVGMDKDVMKRLLRDAGLPIAPFIVLRQGEDADYADIVRQVGTPFFVKPANLGSSVGVHKVASEQDFRAAVDDALSYDRKILIEEFVEGREIECAVLGNDDPVASTVGEIVPTHDFYSYEAKYIDENGAALQIPADISPGVIARVQDIAIRTFKVLECEGLARVDCFLTSDGSVIVNEINTMPGFTKISMYPRLWEASGISYSELVNRLIELGIERFERESRLRTAY